jgi:hypothetical protein
MLRVPVHQQSMSCMKDESLVSVARPLKNPIHGSVLSRKPWRQKPAWTGAPRKKLKKAKIDVERALETPMPHGSLLSAADFGWFEWEIMYPLFVAEGLVDPS